MKRRPDDDEPPPPIPPGEWGTPPPPTPPGEWGTPPWRKRGLRTASTTPATGICCYKAPRIATICGKEGTKACLLCDRWMCDIAKHSVAAGGAYVGQFLCLYCWLDRTPATGMCCYKAPKDATACGKTGTKACMSCDRWRRQAMLGWCPRMPMHRSLGAVARFGLKNTLSIVQQGVVY